MKIARLLFIFGLIQPALAETYAERNAQDREREYASYLQQETQRALAKNARMTTAAQAYARFSGSEVRQETLHCPVRTEIYRYNPFKDLRPYDNVEYQYCEFNNGQDDACYVAQPYPDQPAVHVYCSDRAHNKRAYDVFDNGRVALRKEPKSSR